MPSKTTGVGSEIIDILDDNDDENPAGLTYVEDSDSDDKDEGYTP